jgi:addiction module HigA family antidote
MTKMNRWGAELGRPAQSEEAMISISPPVHPGEILREEYLVPLGLSAGALARRLNVSRTRIERLATERTPVTPDTALRLGKYFGTTPEFWMNMQASYDLKIEAKAKARAKAISRRQNGWADW